MSREIHLLQLGYEIMLLCDPLSYSGIIAVILSALRNNVIRRNNAQKKKFPKEWGFLRNGGSLRTNLRSGVIFYYYYLLLLLLFN